MDKERQQREELMSGKYEREYRNYGAQFDWYTRELRQMHQEDEAQIIKHFPNTMPEIRKVAKTLGMPVIWLQKFIEEHREDFEKKESKEN
jgi:hypothetical protein